MLPRSRHSIEFQHKCYPLLPFSDCISFLIMESSAMSMSINQERADMQVERAGGRLHAVQRRDGGAGRAAARGMYRARLKGGPQVA